MTVNKVEALKKLAQELYELENSCKTEATELDKVQQYRLLIIELVRGSAVSDYEKLSLPNTQNLVARYHFIPEED